MVNDEPISTIPRTLALYDENTRQIIKLPQSDILKFTGPIIILGDPGLGKSVLTQQLGDIPGYRYIRAGSFVRDANPQRLLVSADWLVIDGVDEVASMTVGGGVDAVLAKLSEIGYPSFILSSREADWRGAADRIKIEDDYGAKPTLLHLQPFDRDDAKQFLLTNFSDLYPDQLLDHLANRGLNDIYNNPLTLRLIGEAASSSEPLPSSRAQLIERACTVMLREENERHHDTLHAKLSNEQLLLAAGAHAAAQLLCDCPGVYTGNVATIPSGFEHVDAIAALPLAIGAHAVLHTRLFQADGEHRFQPVHRVVAEFLGSRWLAACFEAGVPDRRILALFGSGTGVPTSLRGIHAWLAHFSDAMAPRCIDADPYAVLRYGDADTMPVSQARLLLCALKRLSAVDPFFRAEDWGRHPAAALMKTELKDDILDIIENPGEHMHLTLLLLEAMEDSPIASALAPELGSIMFNASRYFGERSRAADAVRSVNAIPDWPATIRQLLAMGDEDSRRLAWEQLQDVGLAMMPMQLVVETLLAYIGLGVVSDPDDDNLDFAYLSEKLVDPLRVAQLGDLLDALRTVAEPLLEKANYSQWSQVAYLARIAALRALTLDPTIAAASIWRWLGWLPHHIGYRREVEKALSAWFADHEDVRRAIQTHVMFDAGHTEVRDAMFAMNYNGPSLPFTIGDRVALIEIAEVRARPAMVDIALLTDLVLLDRGQMGISDEVFATAIRVGANDPNFLAKLDDWRTPIVFDWQREEDARRAKRAAERHSVYQSARDQLANRAADVGAGQPNILYNPAQAYIGRYSDFSREAAPETRVITFLGDVQGEAALQGFMVCLLRDDLPSAAMIAESHAAGKNYYAELVLMCGIAERLRREIPLDDLPTETLQLAFMSWRRCGESNIVGGVEIGKPLEAMVFTDAAAIERFFLTSIEPQLKAGCFHVYDLYYLGHDTRWASLAGRLAITWLQRFPSLPETVEAELLACASRHGRCNALRTLTVASRARVHRNYETMLVWLALDYLVDFDASEAALAEAANDDRDFLWFIRDSIAREGDDSERPISIPQRAFVIERFSRAWPRTGRPTGSSIGDTNGWDATEFIERMGYAIGGDPSPEATAALERLTNIVDVSYTDVMRHALALQRRVRRDHEYSPASFAQLCAIVENGLPKSIDDMRAYLAERIGDLDDRMRGSNTDMWQAYWAGPSRRAKTFAVTALLNISQDNYRKLSASNQKCTCQGRSGQT